MRDDNRTDLVRKRHRLERQMWLSPVAATVLPVGMLVAIFLRDRQLIGESTLGWVTVFLTFLAVILVGGIGFRAHEQFARLGADFTSKGKSRSGG